MLVLSRKTNERILIGDDIVITLVEIKGRNQVRLGIEAPDNLLVRRLMPNGTFEGNQADWRREKPGRG